jgi:hypothetical protein
MVLALAMTRTERAHATYRDEEVWHGFFVACPGFTVLSTASGDVSSGAVDDHDHEEDKVEPWEWAPGGIALVNVPNCRCSVT